VVRYVDVWMWQGVKGNDGGNLGGKAKAKWEMGLGQDLCLWPHFSFHHRNQYHGMIWENDKQSSLVVDAVTLRLSGKSGAVTHGMRHGRGQYVVFADADGASKFDDLSKLVTACEKVEDAGGQWIAIGSSGTPGRLRGGCKTIMAAEFPHVLFSPPAQNG
jgi:cellulose synthase/poly-beta-1,6-N-acetylglucosamine synthase-like glycosyltransferase